MIVFGIAFRKGMKKQHNHGKPRFKGAFLWRNEEGVENARKIQKTKGIQSTGKPQVRKTALPPEYMRGTVWLKREGCNRQVFADEEVAQSTCRILEGLGILAQPERCTVCGLVHILELRKVLPVPRIS